MEEDSQGDTDSFNATFKFISEILMEEEDLEQKVLDFAGPFGPPSC